MSKAYMLMANGFEEIEGLMCVDLMRRAGIDIKMVSITDEKNITGARGIEVVTDMLISEIDSEADMLILPGGMPGTNYLKASEAVKTAVLDYEAKGKYLAAICAAPTVFGEMGLLKGKKATCYPGLEAGLVGAEAITDGTKVIVDGKFITSRGLGTAIDFALKLIEILIDKNKSEEIASSVVY